MKIKNMKGETNMTKKAIGFILIGCLILSMAGSVFAAPTNSSTSIQKNVLINKHGNYIERIKNVTALLVKNGTLTQEKANSILSFVEKRQAERKLEREKNGEAKIQPNMPPRSNIFDDMVAAGIITNADATAIKAKMHELSRAERAQRIATQLNPLVKSGKITSNQVNAIISFMDQKSIERKAELEKLKGMSEEEVKAYFKTHKNYRESLMTELVNKGIVTKAQAAEIVKLLQPQHEQRKPGKFDGGPKPIQ